MKYFIFFKIKRLTPSCYIIAGLVFFVHYNISHLKSGFAEISESVEKLGWREIQFVDKKSNRFSRCGQGCIQVDFRVRSILIDDTTFFEDRYYREEISILGMEIGCSPCAPSDLARKGKDDRPLAAWLVDARV